jgi:hypothetical protein
MKKLLYHAISLLCVWIGFDVQYCRAQGEASTYFNVFVPPNNDPVKRNVCLVVTAIFDDTHFEIEDDGADGDTDDSKSGTLSKGQSYILYIADNGINDDARYASGGVWKQDGDYFFVRTSKNVLVSQSTNSDWQHDFVPSIGQKGIGEKFIVYAPQISSSKRDLNTFVYQDSTLVTIKRISTSPTTLSGYTTINYENATVVGTQLLNRGQDIIYFKTLGRDVMETGHTYMVESSKPITLQYGALFGNERDGGGNVPSSNGSSAGDLFYFAVPYQSSGEQEIRVVSWDDSNAIKLERYSAGSWVTVKTWNLNKNGFSDWVGKSNGNVSYPTVFRITGTTGKRVSVFEANWLETGNPGTSDIGSMLSSENGTSAGKKFIAYIAPPGNEHNVRNPFTGALFNQQLSHLYISSRTGANVTVKDAYTNGKDFFRTYDISPERYIDCYLTLQDWKNIYNGTGTIGAGPERPYLIVESDKPVSVFNTNFNDNWMTYLGTAQSQEFSLKTNMPPYAVIPGDTSSIVTQVVVQTQSPINNASATMQVEGNVQVISSVFNSPSGTVQHAAISDDSKTATFTNLPAIPSSQTYSFTTSVMATVSNNQGNLFIGNSVGTITAQVTGTVDGITLQAVSSEGIFINSSDQSQLLFSKSTDSAWDNLLTDSWTVSLVDYNNDNWDDIFISDRDKLKSNHLFRNNGNKTFTKITSGDLVTDAAISISSSWADIDNDGDLDALVVNNTEKPNGLYINNGNGTFTKKKDAGFLQQPAYYHNANWVDYDKDGLIDLFLCNYWPTKFNELWHNDGNGNFSLQTNSVLSQTPGNSVNASWADYDNDGWVDVFLPNNKNGKNSLFRNKGNGQFESVNNIISQEGGYSVASCWGDIDGNGYADLFVSNASAKNNYLYLNQGNGIFSKVTESEVVSNGGHSHGCSFADIDNDGDLDLYVNNDTGDKFLYLNNGSGSFTRRTNEAITVNYGNAMGHAWADLDKDGDLDLFSVTHSKQPNYLFWNNGNTNRWLYIKLIGERSNKSAVGAKLRIKSNGRWQMKEVTSSTGIGGQGSYRNHFGLGSSSMADSLMIHWPSGFTQIITNLAANQNLVITEEAGSIVQATFYVDSNNNCVRDSGEIPLVNQSILVNPLNLTLFTNANGNITSKLAPGNYTLRFINNANYEATCTGLLNVTISASGQTIQLGEIGIKPLCNCADASIALFTTSLRRGFGQDHFAQVSNIGNQEAADIEVKITAPQNLPFKKAEPTWNKRQANGSDYEYFWNYSQLTANETQTIKIRDSVTLNLMVGDEIVVKGEITTTSSEPNTQNNLSITNHTIVGSIDPNILIASPKGQGPEHLILSGQPIIYQIHFENFGNHETSFVTLIDTLSSLMDLQSLSNIHSSHEGLRMSLQGNVLIFRFPKINLTPASIDSIQSKGFVEFQVRTRNDASGVIYNRASILFDYNEPIITNTEMHTVFNNLSSIPGTLLLFPNPVHENHSTVIIKPEKESEINILETVVMDLQGNIRKRIEANSSFLTLDVSDLPNGVYVTQVRSIDGKTYSGRLIILK